MKENPVKVTDTVLRDAHQSLLATRLRTEDMLPIATRLDEVGYHSLEVWGGATFDTCLRFLHEDPWERLRQIKSHIRKTPLQMLLRGQNIVGYRHYPDDIVERFVAKARQNGIDIFRIFDALNDIRNMELAMKVACREGAHVQAAICYTLSPVHNIDLYVQLAKQLESLGAHSICIKDMAGMLAPYEAYELITRLKESLDLPIQLHCHYTSGMAQATYLKAAEAGIDIVDTAISTMALGSSQPPTESFVSMLRGTPRDTGLDLTLLSEIAQYFAEVRRRYRAFESEFSGVDTNVLVFQIPGGMISNLAAQLQEQGALDKMPEVLREVPQVRQELGYPPLVTPSSQIVGTQATLNVLLGKRYKVIPKEVKSYIKGLYGRPPAPVDERIRRLAIDDEETVEQRPADLLPPEYAQAAKESAAYSRSEEDVLSYALFPSIALEFFKGERLGSS
ncbi:MAG: pyruvate/oxaloacetate carboxyltransferase, partial [Chloroflexi bacterium]|nr:pyruvate/oxaloacetate carboxyltransferase [Chloroflexota bacterium]